MPRAEADDVGAVDVLVVGDIGTDVLVRPTAPHSAATDTPSRIEVRRGGQGANQAVWLAAEGVRAGLASRVADDDLTVLRAELRERGVTPFLTGDPSRPTGMIVVLVDPSTGERDMFSDRGAAAALSRDDLDAGLAAAQRWVHVSGYALFGEHGPDIAATAIATARRRGLHVSVDPASTSELLRVGVDRFLTLVAGVDLLLPNEDEALLLAGVASTAAAATHLLDVATTVAVTRGASGALLARRGAGMVERAARRVSVVDTTGAGDAFTAGYLAAAAGGALAEVCIDRGLQAAARAVATIGAQPVRKPSAPPGRVSSSPTRPVPAARRRGPRPAG